MPAAVKWACHLFLGLTAFLFGAAARGAQTDWDEWKPSKMDALQLPRFCWSEKGIDVKGPEFEISRETCGPAVNHYCGALLFLNWSHRSFGNKAQRLQLLQKAKGATLYTLSGTAGYPQCPIREHAEKTLRQINGELQGLH